MAKERAAKSNKKQGVATLAITPIAGPRSWWYFLGGFTALAAVGVLIAALSVQYHENRPVNLQFHTNYLAQALEDSLVQQYIPADNIHTGLPQHKHSRQAHWNFHRFDVDVPETINVDGIKELVREAMLNSYVTVSEAPAEAGREMLSLSFGDLEFARLALKPAQPSRALLQDLRPTCSELVRQVERLLTQVGVAPEDLQQGEVSEQQDQEYLWTVTKLQVSLRGEVTPGELKGRLAEELATRDVRVYTAASGGGKTALRIAARDRDCLRIECLSPEKISPDQIEPIPETIDSDAIAFQRNPIASPPLEQPIYKTQEVATPKADAPKIEPIKTPIPKAEPEKKMLPSPLGSTEEQSADEKKEADKAKSTAEKKPLPPGPRNSKTPAKIGLILDDGGYGGEITERVLALDTQLTLSILPGTPFGKSTADDAAKLGFEVMLHMPMESASKTVRPFPGQLTTAMKKEEIQRLTRLALAETPGAVGVNNHTGGLYTEDAERMGYFLEILKENKLYFVDSRTSPASTGYQTARNLEVACVERDVFLDNENDPDKITAQFAELIRLARKYGQAIGIGHFRPHTVDVLETQLPQLKKENVQLSHVSALMQ